MRSIVTSGYGGRPPFLLALGSWGSINAISSCQGTTTSISAKNVSRLVRFLAVLNSSSVNLSYLPPINPVLAYDYSLIFA